MANSLGKQILEDGRRNAIVKLTGTVDTSDVQWVPAVSLLDFTNNDLVFGTLVGFRILGLDYASGPNLVTRLEWQSDSPQTIYTMVQAEDAKFLDVGGLVPDKTISGYSGNVSLVTRGYIPGTVEAFSVILRMAKLYVSQ